LQDVMSFSSDEHASAALSVQLDTFRPPGHVVPALQRQSVPTPVSVTQHT